MAKGGLQYGDLCGLGMSFRHHSAEGILPKLCYVEHDTLEML